jgi:uncharacterized protein (TIGR03663 family)
VVLLLLFVPLIGGSRAGAAGLAVSPVMVYFSRFYIQETLLLFFTVGFMASLWRHRHRPSRAWAVAAGFFAGMMYATKETSVIVFGSIGAALLLSSLIPVKKERDRKSVSKTQDEGPGAGPNELETSAPSALKPGVPAAARAKGRIWRDTLLGFVTGAAVSFLLLTSFFQNLRGWLDSILSYQVYFLRAGEASFHIHPWSYYLGLLSYSKSGSGPVWSEGLILVLAAIGIAVALSRSSKIKGDRSVLRFLVLYALISTAAYSLIPYKTPWNILPFYLGFILLAGIGAEAVTGVLRNRPVRIIILVLVAAGFGQLGAQAWRGALVLPADPRNPYVYAQTSPGFLKLVGRVEDLAIVHPDRDEMLIKVIAGPYETWPLPWYLRRFGRVGYWQDAASAGPPEDAAVIIAAAGQAELLESRLEASFQSEYYELRPNVFLVLYIRADLWEKYLSSRAGK